MRSGGRVIGTAIAIALVLAACESPVASTRSDASAGSTAGPAASLTAARLGSHDLVAPDGSVIGTFRASEASGQVVRLEVELDDVGGLHPWGLYDQATCRPPARDRDAPFQFADIEAGHRVEEVEAAAYLAFAPALVVIVLNPDGSPLHGCAELGGPAFVQSPAPTAAACTPGDPSVAPPSGVRLAVSREVLSNGDIYSVAVDGSDANRLTDSLGIDMKPSWSPDGSQIAFRSARDGQDEIYVMNSDGTCQRNLTRSPVDDRSPAWSPDGCWIAFDHFFGDRIQDIAVIPSRGGEMRRITTGSGEYPTWSPDGRQIAFASARDGDYDIYVIDADGGNERQLTNAAAYEMYPAWSADGRWLAYESAAGSTELEIHVMRPDGSDDRRVTTDGVTDRFPAWSADGKLAWSKTGTIMVLEALDGTATPSGTGQFPAWFPSVAGSAETDCP